MTSAKPTTYESLIPRLGATEDFVSLRELLRLAGFTEENVCARLGLAGGLEMQALIAVARKYCSDASDTLACLIRFFVLGKAMEERELEKTIGAKDWKAIQSLDLVSSVSAEPGLCYATCLICPTQGLWIAADRWFTHDSSPQLMFPDIVYPAITVNTRCFLDLLPLDPCGEFLELCAGSGIAALAAAAFARESWATDITERSTHFAEFNRRLNGLENVVTAKGDLYQAVGERTFDRIVAHPPYVPSLDTKEIFYDGGPDGERVTRGVIQGLPRHLRPGGRCYCHTLGTDRTDAPWEQRVRNWLGDAQAEFDVALFVRRVVDPKQFARDDAIKFRAGTALINEWKQFFERQNIDELVYGSVVVQRHLQSRPAFTIRRQYGEKTGRHEIDWQLRWESFAAAPEIHQHLLESCPVATPSLELVVRHRMQEGELVPAHFALETEYPFSMETSIAPWTGFMLARCDGSSTSRELFEYCRQNNLVHADTPIEGFLDFIKSLISGGLLEIESHRLPRSTQG